MFDRGAHVTHWRPGEEAMPVLYSSSLAEIGPDRAWRGGIPICAPWFADGHDGKRIPKHGTARTIEWLREAELVSGTRHVVELDADATGKPALLVLEYETQRTDRSLEVVLTITNSGRETAPVEAALHSYFAVSDVTQIEVNGLERSPFFDKVTGTPQEAGVPFGFGALVDRVYDDGASTVAIADEAWARTLHIERFGATKTVVWNPGPDEAPADVGEGEWRSFVCVEAAITGDGGTTLGPDQSVRLASTVTVSAEAPPSGASAGEGDA